MDHHWVISWGERARVINHEQLTSGSSTLDLRIASTPARPIGAHTLILVHGLPRATGMGRQAAGLLPELAEHLASESGWLVATGTLSGVGSSTGTFSASQWHNIVVLDFDIGNETHDEHDDF